MNPGTAHIIARVVKYAVILLGVGIGLSFLGASVQPVLAITLIVVVVMALALRGIASNFAAGIVLQTRHPIKLGDEVEIGGIVGTVAELNGRSVILHTVNGPHDPRGRTTRSSPSRSSTTPSRGAAQRGAGAGRMLRRRGRRRHRRARERGDGGRAMWHARKAVQVSVVTVSPTRLTLEVSFWHHPLKAVAVTSAVVVALALALESAGRPATVTSEPGAPPLIPPDEP